MRVARHYPPYVLVFYRSGNGFTPGREYAFTKTTWPEALASGDFNGDGKLDLVGTQRMSNSVAVFYQGKMNMAIRWDILLPEFCMKINEKLV